MKFLPFVVKHLRRNWVRTASTVVAMALCIFLFCTLQSVLAQIDTMLEAGSASRLVTRHAVSLVFDLPLAYQNRIQSVPGVKRVAVSSFFGGILPAKKEAKAEGGGDPATNDWQNFFPNMAVDADPYFAMYPEFQMPPDQFQAFKGDLQGAVIGRKLANKFGWKIGDHFFLESFIPPYRKKDGPFEFVVRAIYDVDKAKYPGADAGLMFFQFKYLYESTGRIVSAGTYMVEIDDPDKAAAIGKSIDAQFENSDKQTRTETEQAFAASFIAMAGNLAFFLNSIALAVSFTILLVTANTMSMAVRERRTEIAVLKTLGFSSARVMGLIVAEAIFLGALGGALGIGGSKGLIWVLTNVPGISDALAGFGLSELGLQPAVAALGFSVALLLGFAAGFVPAFNAYRSKITEMLRTV
jgi:putative ABC transport system permease protein